MNHVMIQQLPYRKTSGNDKLKVEIIKDGKVLDSKSTTKDYGVVTVSANI